MNKARNKIMIALFVTTFLAAIEGTIVSTAMPVIKTELDGMKLYSWVNSIYLLAMAITAPLYGRLSDVYGRKPLIMLGAIIFTIGSALSGVAWDMISLIIFRAIQGIGGAALIALPMVIIADLYELDKRSKMQGLMSSVWGVAGILGPLAGGLLVDYISWRSIFYINIPFAVIALILLAAYMPAKADKKLVRIDIKGICLFTISMLLFMYSISELSILEGFSLRLIINIILFALSIYLFWHFIKHENKVKEPFISLQLFKNKLLLFTIVVGFALSMITISVIYYVPLWVQDMQGNSATISGLIMIPLSITWPLSSVWAGYLLPTLGLKKVSYIGVVALILSTLGFALLQPGTPQWVLIFNILLAGTAYGLLFTTGTVLSSVVGKLEDRGAAMSIVQVSRNLGQTIGLTVWGLFIFSNQQDANYIIKLANSIHQVFILVAILSIVIVCYIVYALHKDEELELLGLGGKKSLEKKVNG